MGTMMKKNSLILVGFLLLLIIIAMQYFIFKPTLMLVAKGSVNVYESVDTSIAAPPQKTIAKLKAEDRVEVVKSVDIKHYLIYKVRLPNGQIGFINDGEYALLKND